MFLLKSILDNFHSTSFNIIYDSPLIVLKEVTESYIYSNSIEENNYQILNEILKDVNDKKHRESYERNKTGFDNRKTNAELVFEYRKNLVNVYERIIDDLNPLFFALF